MAADAETVAGEALEVRHAINPATAERVELDAPTEDLARTLNETRTLEQGLGYFKKQLGDELIRRMDSAALWTQRVGDYEVSSQSPEPKMDYGDGEALRIVLQELVEEGKITKEAALAALKTEVTYKPRPVGIKAILKLGGDIAKRIHDTGQEVEKRRYAQVRRLRP